MQIRMRLKNGALVVQPSGDLTERAAAELLTEVTKELAPRPRDVVLDLASVARMDARALPYVFRIQKHVSGAAARLVVAGAPDGIRRFFETTRVAGKLELAANENDALNPVA